jgi:hypothetical protein
METGKSAGWNSRPESLFKRSKCEAGKILRQNSVPDSMQIQHQAVAGKIEQIGFRY